tara:strand:- start:1391 stop:1612 length:222 start_codon:yes stop_codon:yes gene_type:complete
MHIGMLFRMNRYMLMDSNEAFSGHFSGALMWLLHTTLGFRRMNLWRFCFLMNFLGRVGEESNCHDNHVASNPI